MSARPRSVCSTLAPAATHVSSAPGFRATSSLSWRSAAINSRPWFIERPKSPPGTSWRSRREREGVAAQHSFVPGRKFGVGVRVVHGVRDVDADPSDRVDQILEAGEPRQDVPVDRHAGQLFDGLHHQVRSMQERLVDLPGSDAGDGDVGVPRDAEDRDRALRGVDADDVERIAARRLGRLAGPRVAPDHQDEERPGGGQAGRAGGLADLRVQIAGGTGRGSARRRTRSTSDRPGDAA